MNRVSLNFKVYIYFLVKIWQIPEDGLKESLNEPIVDLVYHQRRVGLIEWHPTASNILLSSGTHTRPVYTEYCPRLYQHLLVIISSFLPAQVLILRYVYGTWEPERFYLNSISLIYYLASHLTLMEVN